MHLTRRAALLGGTVVGSALFTVAACSSLPDGVPDIDSGPLISGSFRSRLRHTTVGWTIAYPPGNHSGRLPVLVFLHMRGGDHTAAFGASLHLDKYLADAVAHGVRPFAIASVDGGDHEYWHPRRGSGCNGCAGSRYASTAAPRTDSPRSPANCAPGSSRGRPGASSRAATIRPSGARRPPPSCASSVATSDRRRAGTAYSAPTASRTSSLTSKFA